MLIPKCSFQAIVFRQRGAGMIEMMVSLLILGVGLLGVLSLQANGSSSNQRAVFLTDAQVLAQDMADRIRSYGSDSQGARGGEYNNTVTGPRSVAQAYQAANLCSAGCTALETVALDQFEWEAAVDASSLPSGRGIVFFDDPSNTYTVRVLWDQDRTGASIEPTNVQTCNQFASNKAADGFLTCYDAVVRLNR